MLPTAVGGSRNVKRRAFCAAGVAALAAAAVPYRRGAASTSGAEIPAVGLDGRQLTLRSADIDDLRAGLRGELISADQSAYDVARRLWNPAFDRRPALIVRCAGAADVRRAVSFTAAHGLLTAVRGGGHSVSGQSGCDGGLVIDVSPMRAVEVDPNARVARVEAGALLGQLDREALAFGLVTPVGTVADTGVAGLTLGGGVGRIGRRYGLTCDNLLGAELVTADGKWLRVSAAENPDLLWALRGGGGNFGVVTSFTFRLHEVTPIMYGGELSYPFADARQLLRSAGRCGASGRAAAQDRQTAQGRAGRGLIRHAAGQRRPARHQPPGCLRQGRTRLRHHAHPHRYHGRVHRERAVGRRVSVDAAPGRRDQPREACGHRVLQPRGES